jgi:hypothetical protein
MAKVTGDCVDPGTYVRPLEKHEEILKALSLALGGII